MARYTSIMLEGRVTGGASIEFLEVEMFAEYFIPFARIWYSLGGVKQEYGLRLDLDKEVFLDHFEDTEKEEILKKAAPKIVELLHSSSIRDEFLKRSCLVPD